MSWIEAQSTFAIGGFVFGFCYLLAGVIFCLTLMLSRRAVPQSLKEIAPTTLTPPRGHPGVAYRIPRCSCVGES
jgi:uncharacterized membrane protein YccF (DUF307 family)